MSFNNLISIPVDFSIEFAKIIGNICDPFITPLENVFKSSLQNLFPSFYNNAVEFLELSQSPFTSQLPLMNLFHVLIICLTYLTIVFTGKQIMANFSKFSVKNLSIFHNLFLVTLSAYMCTTILYEAWRQGYSLFTNPEDRSEEGFQMAKYIWLFYVSKIAEFMDTFIMILKKNNHQVTFLHVYHHSSIFIIWWWVTYVAPTGETYFSAALNSAVHVVMYGYYLSTTLSMPIRFIKRYITLFQMIQFTFNMLQATYDIFYFKVLHPELEKTYPFGLTLILWFYMWTMLGLFANFFRADRKREAEAKTKATKKIQ
ncbi:delta-6 elongase [Gigaspora margarita]|uniref:Elongation of fatty acids protein n=1 Tax=Gigaspora margarita TaxID=4874 RepID=A0A8H4B3K4_GIGMA|nr:delta-6 elongase [Gigaspora margarita]